MNRMKILMCLTLVGGTHFLTACNNTSFSSGVSPEKELDELTTLEQLQYCDALEEFVSDADITDMVRSITCRGVGITAMFGQLNPTVSSFEGEGGSCEEVYEACMNATDLDGFQPPEFPCREGDWEACNITVGDLEGCISEMTALLSSTEDSLSCNFMEMAGSASSSSFEGVTSIDSCSSVLAGCAGFVPTIETNLDDDPN